MAPGTGGASKLVTGLIGGVAGLGLGAILFGGLLGGSPPPDGLESASAAATGAGPGPSSPIAPKGAPAASTGHDRTETAVTSRSSAAPTSGGRSDAAESTPEPVGDRVLQGVVRDEDGSPLSGVTVRATRDGPGRNLPRKIERGRGLDAPSSLDDRIADLVKRFREEETARQETTTNGEGAYRLEGLTDDLYAVAAGAEGYIIKAKDGQWRVRPGRAVDFEATAVIDLPVRVTRSDGVGVSEAGISLQWSEGRGRNSELALWSADEPVLRLPPETYELRAIINEDHAEQLGIRGEWASESQKAYLRKGEAAPVVELVLAPRLGVRGRVVVPDGVTLDHVQIKVVPVENGRTPTAEDAWRRDGNHAWAAGWSDWKYEALDLAAGRYAIVASPSGGPSGSALEVVDVRDGIVVRDVELPHADPAERILVRVRDETGKPIDDIRYVSHRVRRSNSTSTSGTQLQDVAPGDYALLPDADLSSAIAEIDENTQVWLGIDHGERGEVWTELARGQKEVDIRLASPALLHLTVSGVAGSALEGRVHAALQSDDASRKLPYGGGRNEAVPTSGVVDFRPVQPGAFVLTLSVSTRGERWSQTEIARVELNLVAGDNHFALPLPVLHTLTVRAPGVGSSSATLFREGGSNQRAQFEDGVAVFENLAAGRYTIRMWNGSAQGTMTVDVPAVTDVTFRPDPVDCVDVTVHDDQGWLRRYGLQDGDRIIAIGGKTFGSEAELKIAWGALLGVEKATLTVLRGAKKMEIAVDAKDVANSQPGGSLKSSAR